MSLSLPIIPATNWPLSHLATGFSITCCKSFCFSFSLLSCGKPSNFTLIKSSLDCRLWHWYTYLLEGVIDLSSCFEDFFFLHQRTNSPVIYHSCFLCSLRPCGVPELCLRTNLMLMMTCLWAVTAVCIHTEIIPIQGYINTLKLKQQGLYSVHSFIFNPKYCDGQLMPKYLWTWLNIKAI